MSAGLQSFGSALSQVSALYFVSQANHTLGGIIPDCCIEEQHRDDLVITELPVEQGAAITDHSYKRPATLALRYGFSDSSAGQVGYVRQVYDMLLRLQQSRKPFTVSTGKRLYQNMLLQSIDTGTDVKTANSMFVSAVCKEIVLTSTQSTSTGGTSASVPDSNSSQASPETTSAVVDKGAVNPDYVNFTGNNATSFGGYDPNLGLGATSASGSVGDLTVEGEGAFDNSSLPPVVSTSDPSALGGNPGLFGRYNPNAFSNVQPFRI